MKEINLKIDSKSCPTNPLTPHFKEGLTAREYFRLFSQCGKIGTSKGMLISPEDFEEGYTIFPFDLTPDMCNGGHSHVTQLGSKMEVELMFAKPVHESFTLLVLSTFHSVVSIDPRTGMPSSTIF